jgi:flagellar basal-body rod protein FlgC
MPHDAMSVSASALSANRTRLNVIAENIANANTTRTETGGPYRRRVTRFESEAPSFASLLPGSLPEQPHGVRVSQVLPVGETRRQYMPGHPDADADGYVELPNVNPVLEMTDMMTATRAYEANVSAIQALKSMAQKALELGR